MGKHTANQHHGQYDDQYDGELAGELAGETAEQEPVTEVLPAVLPAVATAAESEECWCGEQYRMGLADGVLLVWAVVVLLVWLLT